MKFKPRKFITKSGKTILVGRNNKENNYLTLKIAKPKDMFLHTTDFAGSHVILQLEGEEPSREEITEAASFAAYFSKGRVRNSVKVDYAYKKDVRKPRKAPAGLVEIDNFKTIKIEKDRLKLVAQIILSKTEFFQQHH